jgi:hypothetical protein
MRLARNILWRRLARKLCVSLTLMAYLAATVGVPVPAAANRSGAEVFPCQHLLCGCQTAEQCWNGCGCFTPEQRLTWAQANQVRPPADSDKPAKSSSGCCCGTAKQSGSGCPHCDQNTTRPCCGGLGSKRRSATRTSACCATTQKSGASNAPSRCGSCNTSRNHDAPHESYSGVPAGGIAAWHCQGLVMLWVTTGAVSPATPLVSWCPTLTPVDFVPFQDCEFARASSIPPDPPPR